LLDSFSDCHYFPVVKQARLLHLDVAYFLYSYSDTPLTMFPLCPFGEFAVYVHHYAYQTLFAKQTEIVYPPAYLAVELVGNTLNALTGITPVYHVPYSFLDTCAFVTAY
jgi:hypothetical protein